MDIGYRSRASLVIKTAVCLIVESMRTGRVGFFHIDFHLCKFLVPVRLVCHRPEDNRRMVAVELDSFHIRLKDIGIIFTIAVIQRLPVFVGMVADPANRRFHFHKHSQFVAKVQQFFTGWIMRGTDKVTVCSPVEFHIFLLQFGSQDTSGQRMGFVVADSSQLNGFSVHQQLVAFYFHFTEAETFFDLFRSNVGSAQFHLHRI